MTSEFLIIFKFPSFPSLFLAFFAFSDLDDFSFLRIGILLASIPVSLLKQVKTENRRE